MQNYEILLTALRGRASCSKPALSPAHAEPVVFSDALKYSNSSSIVIVSINDNNSSNNNNIDLPQLRFGVAIRTKVIIV